MSKRTWTDKQLYQAVRYNYSIAGVLKYLGLSVRAGNYRTIQKYISEMNINTKHFTGKAHGITKPKNKISTDNILINGSTYSNSHLAPRLIKEGLLDNICNICGFNGETCYWGGQKLRLVLDHINGIANDNRIENLRLLCPNCNSQQPTFCRGRS